jgi:[acyl-carrier-protein] S-malonyltransferase
MFPGQGSQQVGMGEELLDIYPNLLIKEFEEALNWSLKDVVLTNDKEEITKTNIAQPYIFAISYCYGLEAIKKFGNPRVAIGHSLGEYTALALGEYITFSDALKIISVRGNAMQKAVENSGTTMAAVLSSELDKTVNSVSELKVQGIEINISNYNDATQIVISGKYEDIDYLKSNPKALNAKRVIPLDVAGAFHSPVVTPAKKDVEEVLENIEFKPGKFNVYMNIDAELVELSNVKERLTNQIDNSVLFHKQILTIEKEESPEYWYHIGPGNVTAGMVKKSISSKRIGIINSLDSLNII